MISRTESRFSMTRLALAIVFVGSCGLCTSWAAFTATPLEIGQMYTFVATSTRQHFSLPVPTKQALFELSVQTNATGYSFSPGNCVPPEVFLGTAAFSAAVTPTTRNTTVSWRVCDLFEVCRFHFSLYATGSASVAVNFTVTATTFSYSGNSLTVGAAPQTFTNVQFRSSITGLQGFHFLATTTNYPSMTLIPSIGLSNIDRLNIGGLYALCVDAISEYNPPILAPDRRYSLEVGSISDTTGDLTIYMSTDMDRWDWAAGPLSFNLAAGTHRFFEVDLSNFDNMPSRQLKVQMTLTSTVGRGSVEVSVGRYRNIAGLPKPVVSFITSDYERPATVLLFARNGTYSDEIHSRYYDSPKRKMYITVRHMVPVLDDSQATVQLSMSVSFHSVTPVSVGDVILSSGGPNSNLEPYQYFRIDTPNLLSDGKNYIRVVNNNPGSLFRAWFLSSRIEPRSYSDAISEYDSNLVGSLDSGGAPACHFTDDTVAAPGGPLYLSAPAGNFTIEVVPPILAQVGVPLVVNITTTKAVTIWFGSNPDIYPITVEVRKIYFSVIRSFSVITRKASTKGCFKGQTTTTVLTCPDDFIWIPSVDVRVGVNITGLSPSRKIVIEENQFKQRTDITVNATDILHVVANLAAPQRFEVSMSNGWWLWGSPCSSAPLAAATYDTNTQSVGPIVPSFLFGRDVAAKRITVTSLGPQDYCNRALVIPTQCTPYISVSAPTLFGSSDAAMNSDVFDYLAPGSSSNPTCNQAYLSFSCQQMFPNCDNTTGFVPSELERSQRRRQCLEVMSTCQVESRLASVYCSRFQYDETRPAIDWITPLPMAPTTAPVSVGSPVAGSAPSGSNGSPVSPGSPTSGSAPAAIGQPPQSSTGSSPSSATGAPVSSRSPVVSEAARLLSHWFISLFVGVGVIFGTRF